MTDMQTLPVTSRQATAHMSTSMEGRARNLEQDRLLYDPSPEPDSALEFLRELITHVENPRARAQLKPLASVFRALLESNRAEGQAHMANAGMWDDLASRLRDIEIRHQLTVKSFVRAVGEPLKVLAHHADHTPLEVTRATAAVYRALRSMPDGALESNYTRGQLKATRYRLLCEIAEGATR